MLQRSDHAGHGQDEGEAEQHCRPTPPRVGRTEEPHRAGRRDRHDARVHAPAWADDARIEEHDPVRESSGSVVHPQECDERECTREKTQHDQRRSGGSARRRSRPRGDDREEHQRRVLVGERQTEADRPSRKQPPESRLGGRTHAHESADEEERQGQRVGADPRELPRHRAREEHDEERQGTRPITPESARNEPREPSDAREHDRSDDARSEHHRVVRGNGVDERSQDDPQERRMVLPEVPIRHVALRNEPGRVKVLDLVPVHPGVRRPEEGGRPRHRDERHEEPPRPAESDAEQEPRSGRKQEDRRSRHRARRREEDIDVAKPGHRGRSAGRVERTHGRSSSEPKRCRA